VLRNAGDADQILVAHQLTGPGCHFRRDSGRQFGQTFGGCLVRQQPVAKAANGEVGDRRESLVIVSVEDEAGDFVGLVRDDRVAQERGQRQVRQHRSRRDPLSIGCRRQTGEFVTRTAMRCLGEDVLQVGEMVPFIVEVAGVAGHPRNLRKCLAGLSGTRR
jgi:hypothetical protein